MTPEQKTIKELSGEDVCCYGCGESIGDKTPEEIFIDEWFWNIFGVVFCTIECRDNYIDSK